MKDNKFDATAKGTVYRRTSKRRVYPHRIFAIARNVISRRDGSVLNQMPARPDGARRASSEIGLAPVFGWFGT
jgi:hypothetical protein